MIMVLEKDRTVILNKDGSVKKIISIAEEALIEENLIEELENNKFFLNEMDSMNII